MAEGDIYADLNARCRNCDKVSRLRFSKELLLQLLEECDRKEKQFNAAQFYRENREEG